MYFTKVINRCMGKYLISLVIKEMQIRSVVWISLRRSQNGWQEGLAKASVLVSSVTRRCRWVCKWVRPVWKATRHYLLRWTFPSLAADLVDAPTCAPGGVYEQPPHRLPLGWLLAVEWTNWRVFRKLSMTCGSTNSVAVGLSTGGAEETRHDTRVGWPLPAQKPSQPTDEGLVSEWYNLKEKWGTDNCTSGYVCGGGQGSGMGRDARGLLECPWFLLALGWATRVLALWELVTLCIMALGTFLCV